MNWLWIFLGGGLGSVARFSIAHLMKNTTNNFPWATLVANGLSCIILGVFTSLLLSSQNEAPQWKFFWMIGFCGGFSTFSTFTAENFQLLQAGNVVGAFTNIIISVLVCLFCFYLGYRLTVTA